MACQTMAALLLAPTIHMKWNTQTEHGDLELIFESADIKGAPLEIGAAALPLFARVLPLSLVFLSFVGRQIVTCFHVLLRRLASMSLLLATCFLGPQELSRILCAGGVRL